MATIVKITESRRMRLSRAFSSRTAAALIAVFCLPAVGLAQQDSETAIIVKSPLPASAVGYVVFDLAAGRIVAAKDAKTLFIPASVAKVPTTVAALEMLGPDYRFETKLYVKAEPRARNGTVADLYLVGGGDPVLDGNHMLEMIKALGAKGVSRVAGRFIYDETLLPVTTQISALKPDHAPHNTGVGALSVNFNRFRVNWVRAGKQAALQTTAVSLTAHLKVAIGTIGFALGQRGARPEGPFVYAELGGRDHWIVSPYLRPKGHAWLPVRKAGLTAAAVFRRLGRDHGIAMPQPRPGRAPADARFVHSYKSQPLTGIVRRVLYFSNNLAAELTGAVATRAVGGKPLTLSQSGGAMAAWLKARMPKADWTGFVLDNHSGLTLRSRMSPHQVLAMLRYAREKRYGPFRYADLLKPYYLPRKMIAQRGYRVRAKSGTMNYIRGRAGYIETLGGRALAFVLFIGQPHARKDFAGPRNDAGQARVRSGPRRWRHQARQLEQALIARWVKVY
ncbi:MAG TPA: D-alanyl-D-alanine carboxypeptidase [Alphaproteobacteria bacterium]|nr:D-alanyl-D-alanine carboxypeptidase [Alphaproteobacteria bacterium]